MTEWLSSSIWLAILIIGLCTFAIRLSFIFLFGQIESVPPRVRHFLRYVPAAVLAALVVPSVVTIQPTVGETFLDHRVIAGSFAAIVAWRTEDVLFTIGVGMGTLWALRFGPSLLG